MVFSGFNLMDYSLLVGIKRRNFEVIDSAPSTPLTKSHLAATQQQQQQQQHPSLQSEKDSSDKAPRVSPLPNNHVPATPASSTTSTPTVNGRLNLAAVKDPDGAMHAAVVEGQGTFYIGIIDILQEWNYDKWYERMFKIYVLRKDGYGLSAMDPLNYRRRFYQRAVLDVFDGLGLDDADDGDIFERYSAAHFPVDGGDLRDTVDTSIASPRNTVGNKGDAGVAPAPSSPHSVLNLDNYYSTGRRPAKELERDSNLSLSESSSFSHEVQLQSLPSSSVSRDSVASVSLMGTDKRFTVKPFAK